MNQDTITTQPSNNAAKIKVVVYVEESLLLWSSKWTKNILAKKAVDGQITPQQHGTKTLTQTCTLPSKN